MHAHETFIKVETHPTEKQAKNGKVHKRVNGSVERMHADNKSHTMHKHMIYKKVLKYH